MRDTGALHSASSLWRIAVAALLPVLLVSSAMGFDLPDFNGEWVEIQSSGGPPMRLQLTQSGSQVQVRASYREAFPERVFGNAMIENGTATWTLPQSCVARFQWPGFMYDNPGLNTFTLSLRQSTEPGQPGPLLVYVQEAHWNVPCANNHPIGTERIEKLLRLR